MCFFSTDLPRTLFNQETTLLQINLHVAKIHFVITSQPEEINLRIKNEKPFFFMEELSIKYTISSRI